MESNGKHVTARRHARRLRDRRGLLGRARHERPAQLLPAHPPGHEADPGRPHRVRQVAQPARRPPRHPLVERVRAGAGARVRQDRRGGARRGHRRRTSCRTASWRATGPTNVLLAEVLTPARARHARRALRAQRVHPGHDLGHRFVRPVGRRARQGARGGDHPRARSRHRARPSTHDSSTNALIRNYRALKQQSLKGANHGNRANPTQLGMIGLGRMGANLVRRLMRDGHSCVVYDVNDGAVKKLEAEGATGAYIARRLRRQARQARATSGSCCPPRSCSSTLDQLVPLLDAGRHGDRRRQLVLPRRHRTRAGARAEADSTTSTAARRAACGASSAGFCLMIGGEDEPVARPRPDLQDDRARAGSVGADAGPHAHRRDRARGLPALRSERRGPLREDGPQRDRVRDDGRDRRGL